MITDVNTLHDVTGREVQRLMDGSQAAGEHSAASDGSRLPGGVDFYRLTRAAGTLTRKLTVNPYGTTLSQFES